MALDETLTSIVGALAVGVEVLTIVLALLSIAMRRSSTMRSKATPALVVAIVGLVFARVAHLVADISPATPLAVVSIAAVLVALVAAISPWPSNARPR